jgi:hypothetical protein
MGLVYFVYGTSQSAGYGFFLLSIFEATNKLTICASRGGKKKPYPAEKV